MTTVKVQDAAFCKILLHCAKYPWTNVFGLLLSPVDAPTEICDVIPVFHSPILAPTLEVAVLLISQHCAQKKLKICGGYYCGEDSAVAEKAVNQICAKSKLPSLLLVVEKEKLAQEGSPFELIASALLKNAKVQISATGSKQFAQHLKDGREMKLADFEDTLEDVTLDFRNSTLLL